MTIKLPPFATSWLRRPFWIVLGGTGLAQIIALIASPLLARLYSPDSFGLLAIFTTLLGLAGACVGGRYEYAMIGETDDRQADALILLVSACALAVFVLTAASLFYAPIPEDYRQVAPAALLGGFAYVVGTACNNWLVRLGMFPAATGLRVLRSFATMIFSLSLFWQTTGLVWGTTLAHLLFAVTAIRACRRRGFYLSRVDASSVVKAAKQYREFPVYGVIPAAADNLSLIIPIYLATQLFGTDDVGQWGLSRMVLAVPLAMVSASLSQVLMKRLGDSLIDCSPVGAVLKSVAIRFSIPAALACTIVSFIGEPLFILVFGNQWRAAGILSIWLVWGFAFNALCSMLSVSLIALRQLALNGLWQTLHCVALYILLSQQHHADIESFVKYFVMIELAFYAIYASLIFFCCNRHDRNVICHTP